MLVVTLLAGGMTMDAKTTRNTNTTQKRARLKAGTSTVAKNNKVSRSNEKSTSGLTFDIFLHSFAEHGMNVNEWGIAPWQASIIMVPKNSSDVDATLRNLGFDRVYKNTTSEYSDSTDEYVDCENALYTKETSAGTTIVKEFCNEFQIEFPSAAEKNSFLKTCEAKGYVAEPDGGRYYMPGTEEDAYWIATFLIIEGNTVVMGSGGE